MSGRFDELERGAGVLYGDCGGIWVMIVFAEPTEKAMTLARGALREMSRRHPTGFSTLTWILPQAGFTMEADARKTAAEVTREFEEKILAQATLIEGAGFQAATVRAIIAGLDFMSRTRAVKKVFSELPLAVPWCMAARPSGRGSAAALATPAQLVASLATTRASLEL